MRIESPFPFGLPDAANACRAWKKLFEMYGNNVTALNDQQSLLRDAIDSCPAFLCGDVMVVHKNGTITWGHAANIFDMSRETAVRGILFLFKDIQNTTAACLQMDAGRINTSLYQTMDGEDFAQFLRAHILPVAFGWYQTNYGYGPSPSTTPLYIANSNFEILVCEYPND